ncbi:MAG TPA: YkvA family protein [Thermomicrobiales bacterium]
MAQTARGHANMARDTIRFWDEIRLALRLYRDPRVPRTVKLIVPVAVLLYVISPVDLIPDVLLGIGQLDDLSLIGIAILASTSLIKRLAPRRIVEEHLAAIQHGTATDWSREPGAPESEHIIEARYRVKDADGSRSGTGRDRYSR